MEPKYPMHTKMDLEVQYMEEDAVWSRIFSKEHGLHDSYPMLRSQNCS